MTGLVYYKLYNEARQWQKVQQHNKTEIDYSCHIINLLHAMLRNTNSFLLLRSLRIF